MVVPDYKNQSCLFFIKDMELVKFIIDPKEEEEQEDDDYDRDYNEY